MQTSAARREEIQKRLQLLKDEGEREQKAFDELAEAHPELSVAELKALAAEKAKAEVPTSVEVAGATVHVNDYVATLDDPVLLTAAERGFLVRDPVKRVYLGERGKVVRVMPSFQGKAAIELRFADGAEKIFFAECLDVGEQSVKAKTAGAATAKRGRDAAKEGRGEGAAVSPKKKAEDEKAVTAPAPAWDQLARPRRGSRQPAPASASAPRLVPPPPPTVPTLTDTEKAAARAAPHDSAASPAVRSSHKSPTVAVKQPPERLRGSAAASSSPSPSPAQDAGVQETTTRPPPAVAVAAAPAAPARTETSPPEKHEGPSHTASASVPPSRPHRAIGLVKEALSNPPSQHASPGVDALGKPSEDLFAVGVQGLPRDSPEMSDLAKTPRPGFLEVPPSAQRVAPCPVDQSRVPQHCPPDYKARFSLDDEDTHIPRYAPAKLADVRHCWVAGYKERKTPGPLRFQPVVVHQDANTLEAVLTVVSCALSWDRAGRERAQRLFTESGREIMWPDAVVDGLRMVATPGNGYRGEAEAALSPSAPPQPSAASTPASAAQRNPTQRQPSAANPSGGVFTVSKEPPPMSGSKRVTPRQTKPLKSTKSPRTGGKTPLSTRVGAASLPASHVKQDGAGGAVWSAAPGSRPSVMHVRVYENGNYEAEKYERVYRTVTIRPTFKSLSSVKALIARELEWRDGKKVDMLFDASGMEITDLDQLVDGASVVASAGNRFVVPYPNSSLHKEALRLAESR